MVEDLDDFLSGDHFFDIAVDDAQGLLLRRKTAGTLSTEAFNDRKHDDQHHDYDKRQLPRQYEHHDKGADNRNERGEQLGYRIRQTVSQRIDVVRVPGHDIAGRVSVVMFDSQRFHLVEHLISDLFQNPCGHSHHDEIIYVCRSCAAQVDNPHQDDCPDERCDGFCRDGRTDQRLVNHSA